MNEDALFKEQLLCKAEGVKDCVKWLEKEIKETLKTVQNNQAQYQHFGGFDDCGDFYKNEYTSSKTRLETMIHVKISLEKYAKKLRHQANGE